MRHPERKLRVKVRRILSKNLLELRDCAIQLPLREVEHCIVILVLQRHKSLTKVGIARLLPPRKLALLSDCFADQ